MNIVNTVVNQIMAELPKLKSMENPEYEAPPFVDLLPDDFLDGAPDLEVFQNPEPDSVESISNTPQNLLGLYIWMHSPGTIVLFKNNHDAYWRSLLKYAWRHFPFIDRASAERVLRLSVNVTYQHERFHYICDFSRRLFGTSFDRWHEEALAVAYSWRWVKSQENENAHVGRLHPTLRHIVVKERFNYSSRGYRDWRQFADPSVFHAAVRDYLCPQSAHLFTNCPQLDFGRWLVQHVADDQNPAWWEEIR